MRKCEKVVENMFSIVFFGMQPNNEKYFQECNQTLENNFFSKKFIHLKIFSIEPNTAFYSKKIFSVEPNIALFLTFQ